jgi:acetyltransferase-like isoleucine patch superfamily enzyme
MIIIGILIRFFLGIKTRFLKYFGLIHTKSMFKIYNIKYGKNLISNGFAIIQNSKEGTIRIGNDFSMNNGNSFNQIGNNQPCYIITHKNGKILIGDNVGLSSTALISYDLIYIENNVKIGGGTVIYDSDFHSLKREERCVTPEVQNNVKHKSITIKSNVFIGANCMILKGVTIGEGSIIGAGSVVRHSVPSNEIWAGNPAVFIKKII